MTVQKRQNANVPYLYDLDSSDDSLFTAYESNIIIIGLRYVKEVIMIMLGKYFDLMGYKEANPDVFNRPASCGPGMIDPSCAIGDITDYGVAHINLKEWNDRKNRIKTLLKELPFLVRRRFTNSIARYISTGERSLEFNWHWNQSNIRKTPAWFNDVYSYISLLHQYTLELYNKRDNLQDVTMNSMQLRSALNDILDRIYVEE